MKAYCISGIGADGSIFELLDITCEKVIIEWMPTTRQESLQMYAHKLTSCIDQSEPFVIIGVSYGGMLACAMNEFVRPEKTLLISSVTKPSELPFWIRWIGKTPLIDWLPSALFTFPEWLVPWFFPITDDVTRCDRAKS